MLFMWQPGKTESTTIYRYKIMWSQEHIYFKASK